jgi:hypothetical protein
VQPTAPKPDKNVAVPKYDLLAKGYDPEKLKKRQVSLNFLPQLELLFCSSAACG